MSQISCESSVLQGDRRFQKKPFSLSRMFCYFPGFVGLVCGGIVCALVVGAGLYRYQHHRVQRRLKRDEDSDQNQRNAQLFSRRRRCCGTVPVLTLVRHNSFCRVSRLVGSIHYTLDGVSSMVAIDVVASFFVEDFCGRRRGGLRVLVARLLAVGF